MVYSQPARMTTTSFRLSFDDWRKRGKEGDGSKATSTHKFSNRTGENLLLCCWVSRPWARMLMK